MIQETYNFPIVEFINFAYKFSIVSSIGLKFARENLPLGAVGGQAWSDSNF